MKEYMKQIPCICFTKNPSISLPYSDFFVYLQWKNLKQTRV